MPSSQKDIRIAKIKKSMMYLRALGLEYLGTFFSRHDSLLCFQEEIIVKCETIEEVKE